MHNDLRTIPYPLFIQIINGMVQRTQYLTTIDSDPYVLINRHINIAEASKLLAEVMPYSYSIEPIPKKTLATYL